MKFADFSIFLIFGSLLETSADDLKCYKCNSVSDASCELDNNSNMDQVDCPTQKCMISDYKCGEDISDDCQSEFNNHRNNNDIDKFYYRCGNEGGINPLRLRCRLCCDNDGVHDDESLNAEVRDCVSPDDKNVRPGCYDDSGSGATKCICNDNLCNDHCTCSGAKTFKIIYILLHLSIFLSCIWRVW